MASDLNCSLEDLLKDEKLRDTVEIKKYITDKIGIPTLKDIMEELAKPGRDPRPRIKFFEFDPNIHRMEDLKPGMISTRNSYKHYPFRSICRYWRKAGWSCACVATGRSFCLRPAGSSSIESACAGESP